MSDTADNPQAWGWCPSVLRPMPLEDGLMVRIRAADGAITAAQARGLADLTQRFGAGVIELTNRANLQLRGLSAAEHRALVPELEALGLTRIDQTPSGRVNITQSPFRDNRASEIATTLAQELAQAEFRALPEKFGFVVDVAAPRVLADVPGDLRIEASGGDLIVRADGSGTGCKTDDPVSLAIEVARWFIASGGIAADGRGRMAQHVHNLPDTLRGNAKPNENRPPQPEGAHWLWAKNGKLSPDALRRALTPDVTELRLTPFRALYLP